MPQMPYCHVTRLSINSIGGDGAVELVWMLRGKENIDVMAIGTTAVQPSVSHCTD
jgi:hypothetical protein